MKHEIKNGKAITGTPFGISVVTIKALDRVYSEAHNKGKCIFRKIGEAADFETFHKEAVKEFLYFAKTSNLNQPVKNR